jgi:rod shape-determining protein MreC
VAQLTEQLVKVTKDSSFIHKGQLQMLADYKLIPAKVVSNTIDKSDNFITIDKGAEDGVRKDMGVVSGNGVVGIVYLVASHYSVVIPVLSTKSNISCRIQGRGYFGYLHWQGGPSDIAYVDDVPRHAHFRLYDHVVTSGYSSVFPPGILVGKILHVYNSADGLSYRLQVKLSTDFGNLRDVCVIDDAKMEERLEVLRAAQDSIKSKTE